MKFKLFGFQVNTLYIILSLIVFLAILYFGLNMSGKEGFSRSVRIVTSLLGDDYNTLPTDDQINKAIGETYDTRFTDPLRNAVYALYKMTIGLPLIMDKMDIPSDERKKVSNALQKESVKGFDVMNECSTSISELEISLSDTIDKLVNVKGPLCGQKLFGQVGLARFEASYNKLKTCKEKVVGLLNKKHLITDSSGYKEFYEFVLQYFSDVSVYLDKFVSDLKEKGECPQPDAADTTTKTINKDGSVCTTKCGGDSSQDAGGGTPIGPTNTANGGCNKKASTNYTALSSQQDNYNHYAKTSVPTLFYGTNGRIAKVENTNGRFSIITTDKMGANAVYTDNVPVTQTPKPEPERNVYYGPQKTRAVFYTDNEGNKAIRVMFNDGSLNTYSEVNTEAFTNIAASGNAKAQSASTPTSNVGSSQPQPSPGAQSGQSIAVEEVDSPSDYSQVYTLSLTADNTQSSLPKGVPRYMIPPGQEDMYILKSEVVPPVCPACPPPLLNCSGGTSGGDKPPPCPPCARCPEPDFTCKKVPNYGQGNTGSSYNTPVENMGNGNGAGAGASNAGGSIVTPDGATPSLPYPALDNYTTFGT